MTQIRHPFLKLKHDLAKLAKSNPSQVTPPCTNVLHNYVNCIFAGLGYYEMCQNCRDFCDKNKENQP